MKEKEYGVAFTFSDGTTARLTHDGWKSDDEERLAVLKRVAPYPEPPTPGVLQGYDPNPLVSAARRAQALLKPTEAIYPPEEPFDPEAVY